MYYSIYSSKFSIKILKIYKTHYHKIIQQIFENYNSYKTTIVETYVFKKQYFHIFLFQTHLSRKTNMRKTGRLNDITRFLNESRKELIFYSIIWLIIYSYHRSDNTDNGKMRYEKPEFENLAKAHPLYDESDNRQCFASYAFDDNRKIEPFIDLVDDDLLKTADGQSIIFHATNCIHDGVPTINLR